MKRSACLAVLLVAVGFALAATPSLGSDTQAPRLGLERVALDGDESFQGNVLLATVDGNEIIAVDTKAGRLYRFHENATELGKSTPIPEVVSLYARAMAAAGDRLAVAGAQSIAVFSERGDLLRKLPLFMPGDIEPDGAGSWLVAVTNIPTGPDGGYPVEPTGMSHHRGSFGWTPISRSTPKGCAASPTSPRAKPRAASSTCPAQNGRCTQSSFRATGSWS